jgi:L-malate glycosyltransferase
VFSTVNNLESVSLDEQVGAKRFRVSSPCISPMQPVKLLVISDYRSFTSSRPEAEAMIGLKKAGLDITIMTFPEAKYIERFREAGIRIIPFHPHKKFDRREIKIIREELISGGYDVLQLFNSKAIIAGIKAAKKLPVKVVLYRGTIANVKWYDPSAYFKYLHSRVDKIICLTESVKKYLDRNPFFDKSKTVTILKGHSPDWYTGVKPADLGTLGIPPGAFVVISVANVRPVKGIPYFIESSWHLPPDLPVHFILIGKGMDEPELKRLVEKSPYMQNFHPIGFVDDPLPYIAASDTLVLASLGSEAINKTVIEAMSLGIPAIITDIEGNKDLQFQGGEDLVVPVKDPKAIALAILKLYNDPALRKALGEQSRRHIATHLNTDNTVRQMKKLYEELAAEVHKESE